jgi:hypothetical protein
MDVKRVPRSEGRTIFANKMLKRIFTPKKMVAIKMRELHNEELHNSYSLYNNLKEIIM